MFKERVSLARHSNYKIGGYARYFFEAKNVDDLKVAIARSAKEHLAVFILGGGTNILFDDAGFSGVVIKPNLDYIKTTTFQHSIECWNVVVGAGTPVSELLDYAIANSLSGLEWAGGLPGTLGGAVRGNAGCFGGEIKDVVESVRFLQVPNHKYQITNKSQALNSKWLKTKNFTNKECQFGYRTSVFKEDNNSIILETTLALMPGDKKKIRQAIEEKIAYRNTRHPMEYPNIGSIFKNIPVASLDHKIKRTLEHVTKQDPFPVIPAAHLISESGLKGVSYGGAMVSPKHPNFIVNVQSATASDVKNLILLVKSNVKEKFGIDLEEEVMILPASEVII